MLWAGALILQGGGLAAASMARARRAGTRWAAALLLAGAALLLVHTLGPGRGIAAWTATLPILAWGVIWLGRDRRAGRGKAVRPPELEARGRWWLRGLGALLAAPLFAIGTGALSVAVAPGAAGTRMIVAGLLSLCSWTGAALWCLAARRAVVPPLALAGVGVAAALLASVLR